MLRRITTVILLLSINILAILAQGPIEGVTSSYTITSSGVPYKYLVYSPPWLTRPQGAPLFVFLHDCTQTAEDFMNGVDAKSLADSLQAMLLFPEQSIVNNEMRCWNWFLPHNHAREGEPKAIVDMIRAVQNRAPMPKPSHPTKLRTVHVDASRIYVAGFGAGGALANTLGSIYPDVFAAIGSHSGIAYRAASDAEKALQIQVDGHHNAMILGENIFNTHQVLIEIEKPTPMPVIILHGRSDLLNRDINSEQMVRIWLLHNHLALQAMYQTHNPESEEAASSDDPLVQEAIRETEFRPFSPAYSRPQFVTKGKSEFGRGITVRKYFDLTDDYKPLVEHWKVSSLGHAWSGDLLLVLIPTLPLSLPQLLSLSSFSVTRRIHSSACPSYPIDAIIHSLIMYVSPYRLRPRQLQNAQALDHTSRVLFLSRMALKVSPILNQLIF